MLTRRLHRLWTGLSLVWLAAVAVVAACDINPQPLPPGSSFSNGGNSDEDAALPVTFGGGDGGGTGLGSSSGAGGGSGSGSSSGSSSGTNQPPADGGEDAQADAEAPTDGGDAGETDAGDAATESDAEASDAGDGG